MALSTSTPLQAWLRAFAQHGQQATVPIGNVFVGRVGAACSASKAER